MIVERGTYTDALYSATLPSQREDAREILTVWPGSDRNKQTSSQEEEMMTVQNTMAALVQIGYDAYNDHSFDAHWLERAAAPIAEECEVIDIPSVATLHGPEGLKQLLLGFSTAFPDSRVEVTNLSTTEDGAVVEFVARGTHTGPLHTPGGDIPPTSRSIEVRFCDVYKIQDGKIVRHTTYYDALSLLQQLGVIPQG